MFIRLTKANVERDRLLVARDAICAVEDRQEEGAVRISTMDGMWYDVVDRIEDIEVKIKGAYNKGTEMARTRDFRHRRIQPISCSQEIPNRNALTPSGVEDVALHDAKDGNPTEG